MLNWSLHLKEESARFSGCAKAVIRNNISEMKVALKEAAMVKEDNFCLLPLFRRWSATLQAVKICKIVNKSAKTKQTSIKRTL